MKKEYVKPETQVIIIEKQVLLAGSYVNASFIDGEPTIVDGGDTSSGDIFTID